MNQYYTVMIIPEREKGVRSFRLPTFAFRSLAFVVVSFLFLLSILGYDYWQILQQVYENKHLNIENKQLKEQIQIFQMKMNSLSEDINRINTFEKKLRIITGLEEFETKKFALPPTRSHQDILPEKKDIEIDTSFIFPRFHLMDEAYAQTTNPLETNGSDKINFTNLQEIEDEPEFKTLQEQYEKKISADLGLSSGALPKDILELNRRSLGLAKQYAQFDFKFNKIRAMIGDLETGIHSLDQHLLDKTSFLQSTPTILPAQGWITSYYGPRLSPWAGKIKMHEGLDVGAPIGTRIIAPADGVIAFAGEKLGFGKFVQIDHGYGVETIFGHSSSIHVKNGDHIKRGDLIAKVGNTGHSTGPHLHYEVRVNGIAVDPLFYILD